jgi:hypothetical protein
MATCLQGQSQMAIQQFALPDSSLRLLCYVAVLALGSGASCQRYKNKEGSAAMHRDRIHIDARILSIMPSMESVPYATATLVFSNASGHEVLVKKYRVVWSGGSFAGSHSDLRIPPGGSREWKVRVGPDSGDLQSLLSHPFDARVEVEER